MSDEPNWMYIGPTVARIGLKHSTLVLGAEPPPQLRSLMELKPVVKSLFVPTTKVGNARRAMETRGTIENIAAEEVIKYAREKAIKERQVKKEI